MAMENDKLKNFPVIVFGYFKKHTILIIKYERGKLSMEVFIFLVKF